MRSRLPLAIVVLLALGLLFGGATHSIHHAEEHSAPDVEEGDDCHFCHLTPALLVVDAPVVRAAQYCELGSDPLYEWTPVTELPPQAAPRAPPM